MLPGSVNSITQEFHRYLRRGQIAMDLFILGGKIDFLDRTHLALFQLCIIYQYLLCYALSRVILKK